MKVWGSLWCEGMKVVCCVLCVVMKKNESWEERNSEGGFMDRGGGTDSNFLQSHKVLRACSNSTYRSKQSPGMSHSVLRLSRSGSNPESGPVPGAETGVTGRKEAGVPRATSGWQSWGSARPASQPADCYSRETIAMGPPLFYGTTMLKGRKAITMRVTDGQNLDHSSGN